MRAVIQRVRQAAVQSDGVLTGEIGPGLLVFVAVGHEDTVEDAEWLARKIPQVRIFEDEAGKMNRSVLEVSGGILVISQFTLYGSLRKGTRPSFNHAAPPDRAIPLYEHFLSLLQSTLGHPIPAGIFGSYMEITALHDGPVTLILDTRKD